MFMASKRISDSNTDQISNLPDAILCHILSFLPTKDSVRTRAVSTRWKHLFSLVPVLNFHNPSSSDHNRTIDFLNFVGWVFNSYNVNHMDTFCYISSGDHPKTARLASWISESVRRKVQKIEIDARLHMPHTIPCDVFTSTTLVDLSVKGFFHLQVPEDTHLPHLRTLSLVSVSFIDGASACRLFRSCPLLDKLFLSYCRTGDILSFDISISSLKTLTILHGYEDEFNLVLDVPNVESFTYISGGVEDGSYTVHDLRLLAKAYINFSPRSLKGFVALSELSRAIRHVQHLSLRGSTLEAFKRSRQAPPLFCNLTYLEMLNIPCFNLELVLKLLDRTPLLAELVINNEGFYLEQNDEDHDEYGQHIHISPKHVPACVYLHLVKVEFKGFSTMNNEFKMVEYLLKNAKILDMLRIKVNGASSDNHSRMKNKLMSFSRYSKDCKIVFG